MDTKSGYRKWIQEVGIEEVDRGSGYRKWIQEVNVTSECRKWINEVDTGSG